MNHEPQPAARRGNAGATALGVVLVTLGAVLLAAELLEIDWGRFGWPLYVIAPGVVLLFIGLTHRRGPGLAIPGSVITIVGLLLLYQNTTGHWESWAYAWALVGPGGSGAGMLLYGLRSADASMARAGSWQVVIALAIFVVGYVVFEEIVGISGRRLPLPEWALPAILVALGVLVLARGIFVRREGAGPSA